MTDDAASPGARQLAALPGVRAVRRPIRPATEKKKKKKNRKIHLLAPPPPRPSPADTPHPYFYPVSQIYVRTWASNQHILWSCISRWAWLRLPIALYLGVSAAAPRVRFLLT